MIEHACVIGSGPAGIACANTLQRSGARVTILDVGFDMDPESTLLLDQFDRDGRADRLIREVHRLRGSHARLSQVQPGKHLFGSNHSYRTVPETGILSGSDAVVRSSLAAGGLTSVWGATVAPAAPNDISDWPISFQDLEPHYRALDSILPIASDPHDFGGIFPMDIGSPATFPMSRQGRALLDDLSGHRAALAADGLHVGRAKVAVGSMYSRDGKGCTPCGLCMHGCPNRAIFSAAHALERIRSQSGVEYRSGVLVETFLEKGDRVTIRVKHLASDTRETLSFDRVFVAGGVINSTAIVARSLRLTDHEFTIRDSQKYIFPLLRKRRSRGAMVGLDNTLAQVYLVVDNPAVSEHLVQVQYYGYNDLILEPLRKRLGHRMTMGAARLARPLIERLMIGFAYLHSSESGTLSLRVRDSTDGSGPLAEVRGTPNPRSAEVLTALVDVLAKHAPAHGGRVIRAAIQGTPPGDSQHIGGTLPMSDEPGPFVTDVLGRPHSCARVHVVDASVFPSIPGTPIAYTAMANASRIAAEATRSTSAL